MPKAKRDSTENRYHVRAVERALAILKLFTDGSGELSLTEISRRLGLHQSTVYRLLATLMAEDFIEQATQSGKYKLGVATLALRNAYLEHSDMRQHARPFLVALRDLCGETVHLAILEQGEVVYLDKLPGLHPIGLMSSRVGGRAPAYCTGVGKALLASLPDRQLAQITRHMNLVRFTEQTITDRARLQHELAEVRYRGYAVDNEEHEEGVACVAAPIFDYAGLAAALSVSGPAGRIREKTKEQGLVEIVKTAAAEISGRIGGGNAISRSESARS